MCFLFISLFGVWPCFFFQAEDGIRDSSVTGVQTCALPISPTLVVPVLLGVARGLTGATAPVEVVDGLTLSVSGDFGSLSTLVLAVALAGGLMLPLVALRLPRPPPPVPPPRTLGLRPPPPTLPLESH